MSMGTWCSGITPAQHAGGPGLNPQNVQLHTARGDLEEAFSTLSKCMEASSLRVSRKYYKCQLGGLTSVLAAST